MNLNKKHLIILLIFIGVLFIIATACAQADSAAKDTSKQVTVKIYNFPPGVLWGPKALKLKNGEMISSSNESGKIVNNYNCYIATVLEPNQAKKVELNKTFQLVFSTGDEVKGTVVHVANQDSGNSLIIFKITDCIEKLINYRKISFEIVWWSANGLRVPNSSIVERGDKNYIIRKRVGYTDDILIKVLKESEKYSIIENYTSLELKELGYTTEEIKNMRSISLYDEILLKPTK